MGWISHLGVKVEKRPNPERRRRPPFSDWRDEESTEEREKRVAREEVSLRVFTIL